MPFVSVGMPVFNGERFLAQAIESILGQTHTDLELIISDNASSDSTADICNTYSRNDPRVKYYRQPKNLGPTSNFNFVMERGRGEFFMWAAYDDVRSPEYISRVVDLLVTDSKAVLAHSWQQVMETTIPNLPQNWLFAKGYPKGVQSDDVAERVEALLNSNGYGAFYGLYRYNVLKTIGSPLHCYNGDGEFLLRVALAGRVLVYPEFLFSYRILNSDVEYRKLFGTQNDHHLGDFGLYLRAVFHSNLALVTKWRVSQAVYRAKQKDLTLRVEWLAGESLRSNQTKLDKTKALLSLAKQYPPFAVRRMFWGALRRQLPFL